MGLFAIGGPIMSKLLDQLRLPNYARVKSRDFGGESGTEQTNDFCLAWLQAQLLKIKSIVSKRAKALAPISQSRLYRELESENGKAAVDAESLTRDVGRCWHSQEGNCGGDFVRATDALHGSALKDARAIRVIGKHLLSERRRDIPRRNSVDADVMRRPFQR
mmetsp:Transcript_8345/g.21969  ORF Transcript_8345/g.21969 Transcript_8345/m.21969 type:complete len:162 (-) Transcript_8345:988-1473(-)